MSLVRRGALERGETLLVHGAAGGVGLAAVDLGKVLGATVIATAHGPTALAAPTGVTRVDVETADEMLAASQAALPADVAVFVAAVADWKPARAGASKIKKDGQAPAPLALDVP